jgi:AraC-like DNA-binding protein
MATSLVGSPGSLIARPPRERAEPPDRDVLSDLLRSVRLSGSLQFCFMPEGDWETGAAPALGKLAKGGSSGVIPFHILVQGECWMKMDGRHWDLVAGDVLAFPFGTGHQLGAGKGGRLIAPIADLPPKPWRDMPILRYAGEGRKMRMLCGYLVCDAISFRPLRDALPTLMMVRARDAADGGWLRATIDQIVAEVDRPRSGGLSVLERLTELTFIELLRHQIIAAKSASTGWLAALADPALARCLALIHNESKHSWSVEDLSAASGLSRSSLTERFNAVLDTSPMRYLREWRLCEASVALRTTARPIAAIAYDAGYADEAAFNRAFSRAYGAPPAAWRHDARSGQMQ